MIPSPDQCRVLYANANPPKPRIDLQGWHENEPIFEELVCRLNPQTYVEVGSWKGASMARINTLTMGRVHEPKCYAVDFWDGEPGLFDQFLYNMRELGFSQHIKPMRGHSFHGALALAAAGIQADLLYIDADHTRNGCLADMVLYYPLLRPGGIMFGDDYTEERGVSEAVAAFCKLQGIRPEVTTYYHWQLPPKP